LYRDLAPFIYSSADQIVADLTAGQLRLNAQNVDGLTTLLDAVANPFVASARLVSAMQDAQASGSAARPPWLCVVHGYESGSHVHKLASRLGGLSIRSPFHRGTLNYDLRFEIVRERLCLLIAERRIGLLKASIRKSSPQTMRFLNQGFVLIPLEAVGRKSAFYGSVGLDGPIVHGLAVYADVMQALTAICNSLFPNAAVIISENNELALASSE
jgi:hypothetical protein